MDSKNKINTLRNQISNVCFKDRKIRIILKMQAAAKVTDSINDLLEELNEQTFELFSQVDGITLKGPIEPKDLIELNEILILGRSLTAQRASWIDSLQSLAESADSEQEMEMFKDHILELDTALDFLDSKYFPDESIAQSVLKVLERK